jgi:hypothetical protein
MPPVSLAPNTNETVEPDGNSFSHGKPSIHRRRQQLGHLPTRRQSPGQPGNDPPSQFSIQFYGHVLCISTHLRIRECPFVQTRTPKHYPTVGRRTVKNLTNIFHQLPGLL